MHPYSALKELVAPVFQRSGHRQIDEEIRPDVFGSAYSTFDNGRSKLRLVWDGKDGCGFAQTFDGDAQWSDIPCYLTEGDIETVPPNQQKIDAFVAAVENAVT
jgi:hypothetical protein